MKKLLLSSALLSLSTISFAADPIPDGQSAYTPFPGDAVFRSLNIPVGHIFGHVALAYSEYFARTDRVIEVLDRKVPFQINTVSDFVKESNYWGVKRSAWLQYSVASKQDYRTRKQTGDMMIKSKILSSFCTDYTLDPLHWRVGRARLDATAARCNLFRCDTFINYIYTVGTVRLPTFGKEETLPGIIWNLIYYGYRDNPRKKLADVEIVHESYAPGYIKPQLSDRDDYISKYRSSNDLSDLQKLQEIQQENNVTEDNKTLKLYEEILLRENVSFKEKNIAARGYVSLSNEKQLLKNKEFYMSAIQDMPEAVKIKNLINIAFRSNALADLYSDEVINVFNEADENDLTTESILKTRVNLLVILKNEDAVPEKLRQFIDYDDILYTATREQIMEIII